MPRLVSGLSEEKLSDVSDQHWVLVVDPSNDDIVRVRANQFRGAGIFIGENEPTINPDNPFYEEYIGGDIFLRTTEEGEYLYYYDVDNQVWDIDGAVKLNGTRVLSSRDFINEINLDFQDSNFVDPTLYAGDFYLNRTINVLFGAYNAAFGFQFGATDFQGYSAFRTRRTFTYQGVDATGYDFPSDYFMDYQDNADPLDIEARVRRFPEDGDIIHVALENDDGHGGWHWIIDRNSALVDAGNTIDVNFDGLCGVEKDTDGSVLTQTRIHAREPMTFNVDSVPVQDNNKYRQGDNVFDVAAGVLYYGYIEDYDTVITDLGDLFEGQTVLSGTSLLNTYDDANDVWDTPAKDDAIYKTGDFILTKDLGTPRIHGTYKFGAASNREAWELYSVVRPAYNHFVDVENGEVLALNYVGDYPVWKGVMIVEGDFILEHYSDVKQYRREVTNIAYDENDAANNLMTLSSNRLPNHPVRITQTQDAGVPSIDDSKYYHGEIIRNQFGDMFQYNESFDIAVPSEMVAIPSLKPTQSLRVPDNGYATYPTVLSRKQGDVQWGGVVIQDGDKITVHYSENKAKVFTAEVNEALAADPANDSITWIDEASAYPQAHYEFDTVWGIVPLVDQQEYTTNDTCTSGDGILWVYDEDGAAGNGKWDFVRWVRPQKTFNTSEANTWHPDDATFTDTIIYDGQVQFLRVGDIFVNTVAGTTKNKQKQWIVTGGYPDTSNDITFSNEINPNGVRYFSEPSTNTGHPNLNDNDYSTGDFIDSQSTEKRYIYVEGEATNTDAWLEFIPLSSSTLTDGTTLVEYTMTVDNDEFFFLEV